MRKRNFISAVNFSQAPKIDFLKQLTTPTGLLQHSKYGIPHRSFGYSLDDNARALLAMTRAYQLFKKKEYLSLARVYLSFMIQAKESGDFFRNFQTFDHRFLPQISQDSYGETMWALAETAVNGDEPPLRESARELFSESEKDISKIKSPRAFAYLIFAFSAVLKADPRNSVARQRLESLAEFLLACYQKNYGEGWEWFESILAYANHILPAALFAAYPFLKEEKVLKIATDSLEFLEKQTRDEDGVPSPIGSDGWYKKGGKKAIFDQQPVEASYAVLANVAAYKAVGERKYLEAAKDWFAWFYGFNSKNAKVYDKKTGGCFDAVNEQGVNLNQGAESIVCYLLAYLTLAKIFSLRSKGS